VGGITIIAAVLYITIRESQLKRKFDKAHS